MAIANYRRWTPIVAMLGILLLPHVSALAEQLQDPVGLKHHPAMAKHCWRGGMHYGHGMMADSAWGMMGGYGAMGMMGDMMMRAYAYDPLGMLQLNDEQRSKIEAIRHEQRKEQLKLVEKMMDEMDKIRDLMSADKRDPSTIGKAYEPVFILQRRMIENRVTTMNKVEAVLSKQQRAELKKFRHHGMGHGMMGY